MPTNILSQADYARAKRALQIAADALHNEGVNVGDASPIQVQHYQTQGRAAIVESIKQYFAREYGSLKGPVQNALNELNSYLNQAINKGYQMDNAGVVKKFAAFLLSLVTEGFSNEDTTGTQMGNHQGSWPGGGFQ